MQYSIGRNQKEMICCENIVPEYSIGGVSEKDVEKLSKLNIDGWFGDMRRLIHTSFDRSREMMDENFEKNDVKENTVERQQGRRTAKYSWLSRRTTDEF